MRTRFLIIDDSELVRQGLRTVLQANPDWEIAGEAADGVTAVELFKNLRPNVVIVDFQMPGINGLETARRLLEIAPAVPVVMFTQHASVDLEKHARDVGIRSVVSKTDAFPMVGIIEALLGSDGPSANGENTAQDGNAGRDGNAGHAKPEKV
ncbi:MAG: response regulator transcription factor [Candidatus Acidiferrales bacterium]